MTGLQRALGAGKDPPARVALATGPGACDPPRAPPTPREIMLRKLAERLLELGSQQRRMSESEVARWCVLLGSDGPP